MPTPFLRRLMARLKGGAEYSLELLQKHFARLNLKAQPHSPRMLGSVHFRLQFRQFAEEGVKQPFLPEQVSVGGVHQSPLAPRPSPRQSISPTWMQPPYRLRQVSTPTRLRSCWTPFTPFLPKSEQTTRYAPASGCDKPAGRRPDRRSQSASPPPRRFRGRPEGADKPAQAHTGQFRDNLIDFLSETAPVADRRAPQSCARWCVSR